MAQFPRVNGDAFGVANFDRVNSGNTGTLATSWLPVGKGVTINPQGPAFDYIGIDFGVDLTDADFQTGGVVEAVINTIQQLATVATYEVQAVQGTAVRSSKFALYPVGITTTVDASGTSFIARLQADIRALGTVAGYDLVTPGATVAATTFGG